MDDVRYSELLFLQAVAGGHFGFNYNDSKQPQAFHVDPRMYLDMAGTLLEELYVRCRNSDDQAIVERLRGERTRRPYGLDEYKWDNPRDALRDSVLMNGRLVDLELTYRGLRRIDELREILKRERVLDDHGILLSGRYVHRDLEDALRRDATVAVSLVFADLDNFGQINKVHGHEAGDEVMKAYLRAVDAAVGKWGTAYRTGGDETVSIIVGQGHDRAMEIAVDLLSRVRRIDVKHKGTALPKVTSSMGVASSPPGPRSRDLLTLADAAQKAAKEGGKNRVVDGMA
jgi:diguanylate cyclase (GGDEF)-like protein